MMVTMVIVISGMGPQMRAMQTAVGAFGGGIWHEDDPALPLMTEVCAEADVSAAHPAASVTSVPFVACELCREHLGVRVHLLCIRRGSLRVVHSAADTAISTRDCCIHWLMPLQVYIRATEGGPWVCIEKPSPVLTSRTSKRWMMFCGR